MDAQACLERIGSLDLEVGVARFSPNSPDGKALRTAFMGSLRKRATDHVRVALKAKKRSGERPLSVSGLNSINVEKQGREAASRTRRQHVRYSVRALGRRRSGLSNIAAIPGSAN
jgi:hypothetical protein